MKKYFKFTNVVITIFVLVGIAIIINYIISTLFLGVKYDHPPSSIITVPILIIWLVIKRKLVK
jgi:hypothetical protein